MRVERLCCRVTQVTRSGLLCLEYHFNAWITLCGRAVASGITSGRCAYELGRNASWFLKFTRRGKGDVNEKKRKKNRRRRKGERKALCDIQESLEREESSGWPVIARLPLACRCIFRTEIKVYDARWDLKPNFPRRDRAIARLTARDARAIREESLTLGISRLKKCPGAFDSNGPRWHRRILP